MKKLLLIALLVLSACSERPSGILLPTYACTVAPTGKTGVKQETVSCGRGCSNLRDFTVHEVRMQCDYTEWRRE